MLKRVWGGPGTLEGVVLETDRRGGEGRRRRRRNESLTGDLGEVCSARARNHLRTTSVE